MSTILLIIISGTRVTQICQHYRIIEKLLAYNPADIQSVKQRATPGLDAGYILIDCNAQLIINAQVAIPLPPLGGYSIIHAL